MYFFTIPQSVQWPCYGLDVRGMVVPLSAMARDCLCSKAASPEETGPGAKAVRAWIWPLPSSSAGLKNEWSYSCTPPVRLHGVHRDKYTGTLTLVYFFQQQRLQKQLWRHPLEVAAHTTMWAPQKEQWRQFLISRQLWYLFLLCVGCSFWEERLLGSSAASSVVTVIRATRMTWQVHTLWYPWILHAVVAVRGILYEKWSTWNCLNIPWKQSLVRNIPSYFFT